MPKLVLLSAYFLVLLLEPHLLMLMLVELESWKAFQIDLDLDQNQHGMEREPNVIEIF